MIDHVDNELQEWLRGECPKTELAFAAPAQSAGGKPTIGCYLYELAPAPPMRSLDPLRPAPYQLALRYLVTASAPEPAEAHRLLGQLVFAAMARPETEVELAPPPAAFWQALAVAPRPSFTLKLALRLERPEPEARLVTKPPVVLPAPLRRLAGVVLGPRKIPIAGARLSIPTLHLITSSDARGRFAFAAVPAEPLPSELVVSARGRELTVAPAKLLDQDQQLTITFPITEK